MKTLYALLVGIDRYRVVSPLRGCRNDIAAVHAFLRTRLGREFHLAVRELYDQAATRAAVIDGFRSHLSQAGTGDTALFWFSGHGSQAPVPGRMWQLEPTGMVQTLVCHDSRHEGVPDLWDKELAVLLREVTDHAGHVVVVLDSCHADGADRVGSPLLADRDGSARTRSVPAAATPPRLAALLPELIADPAAGYAADRHVALAACRPFESAQEQPLNGEQRGLFSWALLGGLARLGLSASYRELLTAARCEVEGRARQVPQLRPVNTTLPDQPFLGGPRGRPTSSIVMRYASGQWEIDAGACHGLSIATEEGASAKVAVHGARLTREAWVSRVLTERSLVNPIQWRPDPQRQYPVVLSSVPVRATAVAVSTGADPRTVSLVMAALDNAGPTGGPSPQLRRVDADDPAATTGLWLHTPKPAVIQILDAEGTAWLTNLAAGSPQQADQIVAILTHIARWRLLRELSNPVSRLAGAVALDLVPVLPGDRTVPRDRRPLPPAGDGAYHLHYRWDGTRWRAPTIFVRLRNRSDQRLYCALLDLTDRYRSHAGLLPGEYLGGGCAGAALRGQPVELRLPPGQDPNPGAQVRDWLKLLVAEEQFYTGPFELPPAQQAQIRDRAPLAVRGVLDRLGSLLLHRDAGIPEEDGASDWATTTVPIITSVPAFPGGADSSRSGSR